MSYWRGYNRCVGASRGMWFNEPKRKKMYDQATRPHSGVLVSIRPKFASRIFRGEKTVELRRKFPASSVIGSTIVVYSSNPIQAVVGYARIRDVQRLDAGDLWVRHAEAACISKEEFERYFQGVEVGYAVLLDKVRSLETPVSAQALRRKFGLTPPQSYRYLDETRVSELIDGRIQTPC